MATMRSSTARVSTITSWIRRSSAGSRSAMAVADGASALRLVLVAMARASGVEEEVADLTVEIGVALDHRPVPAVGVHGEIGVRQDALEVVRVRDGDDRVLPAVHDQRAVLELLELLVRDGHLLHPALPRRREHRREGLLEAGLDAALVARPGELVVDPLVVGDEGVQNLFHVLDRGLIAPHAF